MVVDGALDSRAGKSKEPTTSPRHRNRLLDATVVPPSSANTVWDSCKRPSAIPLTGTMFIFESLSLGPGRARLGRRTHAAGEGARGRM